MENNNQVAASSYSFTNDLFGATDSSPNSSSNGPFSSIFAAPSAVGARNYSTSEFNGDEHRLPHGSWSLDTGDEHKLRRGDMIKDKEGESNFSSSKELNSIFEERPKPSPLSSSLYYGGKEDMYVKSSRPHTSGPNTNNKKDDDGVDDLNGNSSTGASRGNWWQGSLYY